MKCSEILRTVGLMSIFVVSSTYAQDSFRDELAASGIEVGFGVTSVYQRNIKGGLSANDRRGEFAGSYDLELAADLERLLGIEGTLFIHGEGGWSDSEGIDGVAAGSHSGVNADAIGNRSLDIVELFYEVGLTDELTLTIGKIDFTGYFDASAYANDEAAQFLNGALVNNPTIPFPDYSLGVILTYDLSDNWYLMGGVADAQADGRETGFNTAFHDEDYFFYILETGITTAKESVNGDLEGIYRLGVWNDPQPKAHSDATKDYRDDIGFYASVDQMLTKENNDPEDIQGLGVFLRYGYVDEKRNDMEYFYSFGAQYQGLIDGRDYDVFGIGYANGHFSDNALTTYTKSHEGVIETYYSIEVSESMHISPDLQYVINPGGVNTSDALLAGLRVQVDF